MKLPITIPTCEYVGCDEIATELACTREYYSHKKIGQYCKKHAIAIAHEDNPEYVVECPNCGCWFGVN